MTTGFKNICESLVPQQKADTQDSFAPSIEWQKMKFYKSSTVLHEFWYIFLANFWEDIKKMSVHTKRSYMQSQIFFSLSKFRIHQVCSFGSMQKIELGMDFSFYSVLEQKHCNTSTDLRYKCFPVYQAILYLKFRFLTILSNIQFRSQTDI